MTEEDPEIARIVEAATIRMPYLPDDALTGATRLGEAFVVEPDAPLRLRRAAEELARQYQRETHGDLLPYRAAAPGRAVVVLLPAHTWITGYGQLIAGAIGVDPAAPVDGVPGAIPLAWWVYLHPYERGRGAVINTWPWLLRRWPGICLAGPFTAAGLALLGQLVEHGLHPERIGDVPAEHLAG